MKANTTVFTTGKGKTSLGQVLKLVGLAIAVSSLSIACQKSKMSSKGISSGSDLRGAPAASPANPTSTTPTSPSPRAQTPSQSAPTQQGAGGSAPQNTDKKTGPYVIPTVTHQGENGKSENTDSAPTSPTQARPAPIQQSSPSQSPAPAPQHDNIHVVHSNPGPTLPKCADECTNVARQVTPSAPAPARPEQTSRPSSCEQRGDCPTVVVKENVEISQSSPAILQEKATPVQAQSFTVARPYVETRSLQAPLQQSPPTPPAQNQCYLEAQDARITNKIDVLFILDTSESLDKERSSIAHQVDRFIDRLLQYDSSVDIRFAVMLAHGPGSVYKVVDHALDLPLQNQKEQTRSNGGWVVQAADRTFIRAEIGDPAIMATKRNAGDAGEAMSMSQIKASLMKKLNAITESEKYSRDRNYRDSSDVVVSYQMDSRGKVSSYQYEKISKAHGEAGMLTLENAIQGDNLAALSFFPRGQKKENLGMQFFRSDAALAVVFISDENDVCFDYAKAGKTPRFLDPDEVFSFKTICDNGQRGQADQILASLKKLKGKMPFTVNGILYTSDQAIKDRTGYEGRGARADENEMGHGYLDLIRLSGGLAFDLGTNYGHALVQMADIIGVKMFRYKYPLKKTDGRPVEDVRDIQSETLEIKFFSDSQRTQQILSLSNQLKARSLQLVIERDAAGEIASVVVDESLIRSIAPRIKSIEISYSKKTARPQQKVNKGPSSKKSGPSNEDVDQNRRQFEIHYGVSA